MIISSGMFVISTAALFTLGSFPGMVSMSLLQSPEWGRSIRSGPGPAEVEVSVLSLLPELELVTVALGRV